MDQTGAGGSLQAAFSWGGTWHVPSQGHAWHVAFPSQAQRCGRAALLTVKTKNLKRFLLPVLHLLTFPAGLAYGVRPGVHSSGIISCLWEPECYEKVWS